MSFHTTLAIVFIGLVLVFSAARLWQLRTKNAGMVDPVWAAALGTGATINRVFVTIGGASWGFRLVRHFWMRNHGKPEDPRYRAFRERWGKDASRKMFWFFQLQTIVSMPLAIVFFVPAYAADAAHPFSVGRAS